MPQSSLMTWLKDSAAVKRPEPVTQDDDLIHTHETRKDPKRRLSDNTDAHEEHTRPRDSTLLHSNLEFRSCTKEDISRLKTLTSLMLPISYPETFYREIVDDSLTNSITLLAIWHDDPSQRSIDKGRLVGAMRCRLLTGANPNSGQRFKTDSPLLYISTLAVLSPYRSLGVATHMLQTLTKRAAEKYGISRVGAHVWEANTDGLAWYRKRGFVEIGREDGYYRQLSPRTAVVVERKIEVKDLLSR